MKRLIILLCSVTALLVGQDAAGQYKLTGVDVLYTYVTRADVTLTVTDAYGFGITQGVADIPGAFPFTSQTMRLSDAALAAIGINLNVTLNADGSGSVAEGSYYPDVNTITDENGNCVTLQQVLPVTDEFTYESMGNGMQYAGFAHPGVNVLGLPGISSMAGQQLGLFGLSGSFTFEDFQMFPIHPTLCTPDGDCFPFTVGDIDGSGSVEVYPSVNLLGIPEYVPGGAPLTGLSGGFFIKRGLNDATSDAGGPSIDHSIYDDPTTEDVEENTVPDFHLEWHGVDGIDSGLGWGDDEDVDEDDDGTWYDRILGIPGITATYMNPAYGFNQPIWGDVSDVFPAEYVDYVGSATDGYLMDPSGSLATWGNFLTAHGALLQQCAALLGETTCAGLGDGILLTDDSTSDMDPSCLSDYDGTAATFTNLLDCAGRLTMSFDIPCVPIIEAREVIAEFIEVGAGCGSGDMNADGVWNVLDVVALVNAVLTGSDDVCSGDVNADGGINVLDVVQLVNCVLNASCDDALSKEITATSVEFNVKGNEVTMSADGIVGGIQMTLSHGNDFALTFTDDMAWSLTEGNTTTLIIVNPEDNLLFTANGDFTIESVIASDYEGDSQLNSSINNMPKAYSIGSAYPNPFNPTTQMSLDLNTDANVSVKVFNTMGQLIDVITQGQMASGNYNLTWDGTNVASGIYLIQTAVGTDLQTQKIMLIK